jgi:hypothetical protein
VNHLLALQAISEVQPVWMQKVLNSYVTDPKAQELLTKLSVHSPDDQGFSLEQGLIKHNNRVWRE